MGRMPKGVLDNMMQEDKIIKNRLGNVGQACSTGNWITKQALLKF
jgi:hypothetical protein